MAIATQRNSSRIYLSHVILFLPLAVLLCLSSSSAWVLPQISTMSCRVTTKPSSTARYNLFDDWFGPKKQPSATTPAAAAPPVPTPAPVVENKQQEPPKEATVVASALEKVTEPVVVEKQEPTVAEAPAVEEEKQATTPVAEKKEQSRPPVVEGEKEEQEAPKVEQRIDDDTAPDAIHKGKVRWYNQQKGFGFLECANGSPDVFVHQSAIHKDGFRSLLKDEEVEFRLVKDDKGRNRAVNVTGPGGKQVIGVR
jgi:cold shock CspA family protein